MAGQRWGVVVPLKPLGIAKSRLGGGAARAGLALAFAADVVAAALACPGVECVVVVTDDPRAAAALAAPGVLVHPDAPGAGLNPALEHGAGLLGRLDDSAGPLGVVALAGDLPALRTDDLARALAGVASRAFVADAAGLGTTLLAAVAGTRLTPAYGPRSRERHLAGGALELDGRASLRRDVDTAADLEQALRLGVGPHTAAALARLVAGG